MAQGRKTGGRQQGSLNSATSEVKILARDYGPGAIRLLAQLAGLVEGIAPAESDRARIAAAKELLDRGYGKAVQPVGSVPDEPITVVIRRFSSADPAEDEIIPAQTI